MGKIILWMSKKFYHHTPLCVWLVQVISKWACRNMLWKVQVEHWVFRNKPFAIVALWWLKNSWNRCALFFNISVWFGTFEGENISEWNLVLKKSLRIQGFFPSCQQTWLGSGEVVSNWITSDCLLGGLFTHLFLLWNSTYKPHEFRILFTSLWKRPQPLPVWGWEFFRVVFKGGGHLQPCGWGGGSLNLFKWHHYECLNNPISSNLASCTACCCSINSSLGLTGGKPDQKITILDFRLVLQFSFLIFSVILVLLFLLTSFWLCCYCRL